MSSVEQIWRYPVKSMLGERVTAVDGTDQGVAGDRQWAVIDDDTGLVASVKSPRKWADLLQMSARWEPDRVSIDVGSGEIVTTDDPNGVATALSARLGRGVSLAPAGSAGPRSIERDDPDAATLLESRALGIRPTVLDILGAGSPPGTFFDFAPIHLVNRATLDHLEGAVVDPSPDDTVASGDIRRFRPNLVLDIDAPAFAENAWPGQTLVIGDVRIEILLVSPRCVVPTLAQGGLQRNVATLRAIAQQNRVEIEGHGTHSCVGAYGRVIAPGEITEGSGVELVRA